MTSAQPFSDEASAQALADEIDWHDLYRGYIDTMLYTFRWLSDYQALPQPRESVLILVGDHQPAGGITGPGASWNVPVHIITGNTTLADRLRSQGFSDGVNPPQETLAHISELPRLLLTAFDSEGGSIAKSNLDGIEKPGFTAEINSDTTRAPSGPSFAKNNPNADDRS